MYDSVGIAIMTSTGQPEADMIDYRRGGVRCRDQPVVTIAPSAAAVAAGRERTADAECPLMAAAVARFHGQFGARDVLPDNAISGLLQLQADGAYRMLSAPSTRPVVVRRRIRR